MPDGDKLIILTEPKAVEVRLRVVEQAAARLQRRRKDPDDESVNGEGFENPVPRPEATDITLTPAGEYTKEGNYREAVLVTVSPDLKRRLRGFDGYEVRLVSATGEETRATSTVSEVGGEIVENPLTLNQFPPLTHGSTSEGWQVYVRLRSAIFGPGPWSEALPLVLSAETAAPATPTGLVQDGDPRFNTLRLVWDPVDTDASPDWVHTDICQDDGVKVTVVGSTIASSYEVNHDPLVLTGSYTYFIRHVDKYNNTSAASSTVIPMVRKVQADDLDTAVVGNNALDVITDPTKFEFDIETNPLKFYDAAGHFRGVTSYNATLDTIAFLSANPTSATKLLFGTTDASVEASKSAKSITAAADKFIVAKSDGSSAVTETRGSSFPRSPASGDRHYHTTYHRWAYWDGTNWLSEEEVEAGDWEYYSGTYTTEFGGAGTTEWKWWRRPKTGTGNYIKVIRYRCSAYINGTCDSTNKWEVILRTFPGLSTMATYTFNSSGSTWLDPDDITSFSAQPGSSDFGLEVVITKTGSPGPIRFTATVFYRLILG